MGMNKINCGFIFKSLCERRDRYWVEYTPARMGQFFASLSLTYIQSHSPEKVIVDMEKECVKWIKRYSVPMMETAFDDTGNVIELKPHRNGSYLMGIPSKDGVTIHWELLADKDFPHGPYDENELKQIYNDLPYTTQAERTNKAIRKAKQFRRIYICLAILWLLPPVLVFAIGFTSPLWGTLIGLFSIGQAFAKFAKGVGWMTYSDREKARSKEALRKDHHHYHCERNPLGFLRLKCENFEQEAKADNYKIAKDLTENNP